MSSIRICRADGSIAAAGPGFGEFSPRPASPARRRPPDDLHASGPVQTYWNLRVRNMRTSPCQKVRRHEPDRILWAAASLVGPASDGCTLPSPGLGCLPTGRVRMMRLDPDIWRWKMMFSIRISEIERGKFRASCPCLPGCVAYGQTREQAREKLDQAVTGYLASLNVSLPSNSGPMFELQEA